MQTKRHFQLLFFFRYEKWHICLLYATHYFFINVMNLGKLQVFLINYDINIQFYKSNVHYYTKKCSIYLINETSQKINMSKNDVVIQRLIFHLSSSFPNPLLFLSTHTYIQGSRQVLTKLINLNNHKKKLQANKNSVSSRLVVKRLILNWFLKLPNVIRRFCIPYVFQILQQFFRVVIDLN